MAIQFRCPGCSQPIEVDDQFAGQTAACPYCRRVVNVPTESILDQSPPVTARPAAEGLDGTTPSAPDSQPSRASGPVPPAPPGGLHVGPALSYRDRSARVVANYALICTTLSILLFGAVMAYSVSRVVPEFMQNPGSQPSPERMAEIQDKLASNPWTGAGSMGGAFFALVGLVLGITSLVQSRQSNWRAVISVVLCGLCVLCFCGGTMLAMASGIGAPAAIAW